MLQGSVKGHHGVLWSQLEQRDHRKTTVSHLMCAENTHQEEIIEL